MTGIMIEDAIFTDYIQWRAEASGEDTAAVEQTMNRETFYETVYALHEQFMAGEFSLGYMAEQLGINKADLYHLLDAIGLKVTNI